MLSGVHARGSAAAWPGREDPSGACVRWASSSVGAVARRGCGRLSGRRADRARPARRSTEPEPLPEGLSRVLRASMAAHPALEELPDALNGL
jgi:hypothetical protein